MTQRDPYDWLLESYIWRFSAGRQLELRIAQDEGDQAFRQQQAVDAIAGIVKGILQCAERVGSERKRREEFREIVYRIVNNVRRIEEKLGAGYDPGGLAAPLDLLAKDHAIVDPQKRGLASVVDWVSSDVSSADLASGTLSPEHSITLIVQRQFEDVIREGQEGRFLEEAFIAPPNWLHWTAQDGDWGRRPSIEGSAGCRSGELAFSFTQTRRFAYPTDFEHLYRYEMTWSPREYRFDFQLDPRSSQRPAFAVDHGYIRASKRLGHPGETVISVQREAWLQGRHQELNVYIPAILRMQMFDALCVWLKDFGECQ